MRGCFAFVVALLLAVARAEAQVAVPAPPRDTSVAGQAQAAAARLSGRVLDGATNRPLRRAVVQLSSGNLQTDRWTWTNSNGEWSFTNVAAGSYMIKASRDGYVTLAYGQKGAFGTAPKVVMDADQQRGQLDIVLPRGGVITGRIVDEYGDPVGGALVQPLRLAFVDGLRQLVSIESGLATLSFGGLTDDRGEFRLYGLPPGEYYLSATYGVYAPGQSNDRATYATTYHPGTASVAGAMPLRVSADEPATATFALAVTPLAEVSGRVVNSLGEASAGNASLVAVAPGYAVQATSRLSAPINRDGTFVFRSVPSGEYYIQARVTAGGVPEVASVRLSVAGQDIRAVSVATAPAATVTGTLVLEDRPAGARASDVEVMIVPADASAFAMRPGVVQTRGDTAGNFSMGGIVGRHYIRLRPSSVGWWLKSVTIDGVDVTDSGFDFGGGRATPVVVVASRRMGSVSGVVRRDNGQAVSQCSVVVFAVDEAKWAGRSRYIAATTPNDDGTFTVAGLPPGPYVAIAVSPLEAGEEADSERLIRWRGRGTRLTLGDSQPASVTLTLQTQP